MTINSAKLICGVNPNELSKCNGIAALDMDGVISESWLRILRHENPTLQDPRVLSFMQEYPYYFEDRILGKTDVRGIQVDALCYLVQMAHMTKTGFVLVSSWVRKPETYLAVQHLLLHLTGLRFEQHPLFLGQTGGGGGEYRETEFLAWLKLHTSENEPKEVIAIDDSGDRHFPIFSKTHNLVAPVGRVGYTMDDYIRSMRKLRHDDDNWYGWADHGYVEGAEFPLHTKEELWARIHQEKELI